MFKCLSGRLVAGAPQGGGQWTMPAKNHAAMRFCILNRINTGNLKDFQVMRQAPTQPAGKP